MDIASSVYSTYIAMAAAMHAQQQQATATGTANGETPSPAVADDSDRLDREYQLLRLEAQMPLRMVHIDLLV